MLTNIYHITYTPEIKEVELFFWGCNMTCKGCLCKRTAWDFLLKETKTDLTKPPLEGMAKPPEKFLELEEVLQILDKLDIKQITLGGMEPTIDPMFPEITKALHERYGSFNVVFTNLYEISDFKDTDIVVFGLNAVTDSLHEDYCGNSNKQILENFAKVYQQGNKLGVATPFIPGYIGIQEIENIAKFLADTSKDISYFIRPYCVAGDNPWRSPDHQEMDEAVSTARKHLNKVNFLYGDEELKFEVITIFPDSGSLTKIVQG
ncbi:radical SAM protein [Dehalogenimonas sp. THU2]|uniref:radical SAM protein n=1 Tax=Dehalogenimonas sp. THU2 TaxID=3151121 RepID=UPI003218467F